jgi:hypothetical protein
MFTGAETIDTVIRAIAAIDRFGQRTNLDTIVSPVAGTDPIEAEKFIFRGLGYDLNGFMDTPYAPAFDLIGVTG